MKYKFESKAGVDMGTYGGETEQEALEALNKDANDKSELLDWIITEVPEL